MTDWLELEEHDENREFWISTGGDFEDILPWLERLADVSSAEGLDQLLHMMESCTNFRSHEHSIIQQQGRSGRLGYHVRVLTYWSADHSAEGIAYVTGSIIQLTY